MPVEIKVGPPVITINQGTAFGTVFMVTDEPGDSDLATERGLLD